MAAILSLSVTGVPRGKSSASEAGSASRRFPDPETARVRSPMSVVRDLPFRRQGSLALI